MKVDNSNQSRDTQDKQNAGDRTMSEASMRGVDMNNVDEKEDILDETGEIENSEEEKSRPYVVGEQSASGEAPNPDVIHKRDVLERAQKTGLYTEAEEGHPHEVDIAEEVDESEQAARDPKEGE